MIEFFYAALNSPLGIIISTDDPDRCRQKLYAARRAAADPALDGVAVTIPATPNEVWLVKKDSSDGSA